MDDWPLGMDRTRNERTIAAAAAVEGVGYWSGRDVRVEFRPAEPARASSSFAPICPAAADRRHVANRTEMPRRTTLRAGEAGVEMVEHVMAALAGLQIDNCEVWVDQAGNARLRRLQPALRPALGAAGIVAQDAPRPPARRSAAIALGDAKSWIEARPCCRGGRCSDTSWTTAAATPSGGNRWKSRFAPVLPHEPGPQPHVHAEGRGGGLQAQGLGHAATCRDLLVFDAARADRQYPAFPRRMRAPQDRST